VAVVARDAVIGFILALGACVLVGRFIWNGIDHPASPAQRVGALIMLVVIVVGAAVVGIVVLASKSSGG
jgi:hypothetical protein